MVIEYIGEIIRSELSEIREKKYEAKVSRVSEMFLSFVNEALTNRRVFVEPRYLHVPPGRAARSGRDPVRRPGAVHQPLVPTQLCGGDGRGGPTSQDHHLR